MKAVIQGHVKRQLEYLEANEHRLTIDADTHVSDLSGMSGELLRRYQTSPNYYHGRPISAEDVLAEMAMAKVDMALIWQNPAVTEYGLEPRVNYEVLLAANRYVHEMASRHWERLIPGGWTDPKALGVELALELVEKLVLDFGFLFVKLNPGQNRYPIHSESVQIVVDRIIALGAIPAFHFGADTPFTPADGLSQLAAKHPNHPMLAVHMGGGGAAYVEAEELYGQARELGLQQPNIRYVLSAKRDTHIENDLITYQLAGEPFCRNLFYGSDAPYGRMTWNAGGLREMFRSLIHGDSHTDPRVRANPGLFSPEVAQRYFGGNFARFVIAGYRRLLAWDAPEAASNVDPHVRREHLSVSSPTI